MLNNVSMHIVHPTTPAQYYHLLHRQVRYNAELQFKLDIACMMRSNLGAAKQLLRRHGNLTMLSLLSRLLETLGNP